MPHANAGPDEAERHVFVYGTLRRGGSNDITRLRPAPRLVGAAVVAGALYDFGAYPGLVLGGEGMVIGEVYAIEEALERVLDVIEGIGPRPVGKYIRREVAVVVDGRRLRCLVYEVDPLYLSVQQVPRIARGDWLAWSA
ncbi:gamma-glutamylcyclotransferase [Pseudorhodoferax sp. Leaf267]|uniref:gamma-glutamylcyclotransferase family protein n=1 Tax=Pseudorhodoferax sp. Leaf267 TaxID=1736316 RepID=UPI0006FF130F|nr:gamma-glutamylcyclotransferase family protein [Pseudorhodoferax sp. Leaf267]KQP18148.1 gamma-glutamyl cyclotransferase [Pseudorhodoferax sp. Leaf267]